MSVSHVIGHNPADGTWLALVDPEGEAPYRAPLTGASTQLSKTPPVFSLKATWPNLVQLFSTLPGAVLDDAAKTRMEQLSAQRVGEWSDQLVYPLPDGVKPYPWQASAASQLGRTGALLLSDEPGTGKTGSAVLGVAETATRHLLGHDVPSPLPVLVLAPASVVTAWVKTFRQWVPGLVVDAYLGTKRAGLRGKLDVYVTSYETASRDADALAELDPATVVMDEHHMVKTPTSARSKAARKLAAKARYRLALSGTPITHHPGDLWPALNALDPDSWPSRTRFKDRYLDVVQGPYADEVVGFLPHRRPEYDLCMTGVHRRVAKADALPWLPPKVHTVREVTIPAEWRKAYDAMRDEMLAELPDGTEPLNAMSTLAQLTRLQQLAAAPCDVETTQPDDPDAEPVTTVTMRGPSWKVSELMAVLAERETEQVAVFSPSRQLVELAAQALEEAGITYAKVVGDQKRTDRDADVEAFQAGERRVILVTTQAGGVGLTLTAARCAVFLSRPWSLVEATQAEDRLHRIGAEVHDSVDIVDIVSTDTVDDAIRAALVDKATQLSDVLHDPRVVREVLGGKRKGKKS